MANGVKVDQEVLGRYGVILDAGSSVSAWEIGREC